MKTAEIIGDAIIPVSLDGITDEFPIEDDLERQNPSGSDSDLDILAYSASYDGKENQTECYDGNRRRSRDEIHMSEEKIDDRQEDKQLAQSGSDEGDAQFLHLPENLKRQLLDAGEHEARRE